MMESETDEQYLESSTDALQEAKVPMAFSWKLTEETKAQRNA